MDDILFKVRENSKVINKTVYTTFGLLRESKKKAFLKSMAWQKKSVACWISVMTDIRALGTEDIFINQQERVPIVQNTDMCGP